MLGLPSGAEWMTADLHVHTQYSADMSDQWKDATPDDVVGIALGNNLDAIAVTDHNTAYGCDAIRAAADGTPLTVFPGVEISTAQGHVLAIFDVDTEGSVIEDLLVKLGFARGKLGSLHVATEMTFSEVCRMIEQEGGVAIAAHAEKEKGFLTLITVGDIRQKTFAEPSLRAIEIVDPSLREQYGPKGTEGYPRLMACIQSSDSWPQDGDQHQLDSMGQRFTRFKMSQPSLAGLKLALLDPEMRVRLASDNVAVPSNHVEGMWITGGFLDDQQFRFNEGVTCIIGDTGTGKSLAIELLRYCLDQQTSSARINPDIERLLSANLGELGVVHTIVSKNGTRYQIDRSFGTPGSPPVVQGIDTGGTNRLLGQIDMESFFPIKAFSQGEIIEFAYEDAMRLSLTDDLIDRNEVILAITDCKSNLKINAANIITEQEKKSVAEGEILGLTALIEERDRLDDVLSHPNIAIHQQWDKEQRLIEEAHKHFSNLPDSLVGRETPLEIPIPASEAFADTPNVGLMAELSSIYAAWASGIDRARHRVPPIG